MKNKKIKVSSIYGETGIKKYSERLQCKDRQLTLENNLRKLKGLDNDYKETDIDKLLAHLKTTNGNVSDRDRSEVLKRIIFFKAQLHEEIHDKFKLQIEKFRKAKKILVVFHDNDIDGHFIKIISKFYNNIIHGNSLEINFFPCTTSADEAYEYIKDNIDYYDLVIVGDLSFTEEYCERINIELDVSKLIVLDHHKNAGDVLNKYNWALVFPHDIYNFNIICGTMMYSEFILISMIPNILSGNYLTFISILDWISMNIAAYDTWFSNDLKTKQISNYMYFGKLGNELNILFKHMKKTFDCNMLDNLCNLFDNPKFESVANNEFRYIELEKAFLSNDEKLVTRIENNNIQKTCEKSYNSMFVINVINEFKFAVVYTNDGYVSQIGNYILEKQPEIDFVVMVMNGIFTLSLRSRTNTFDMSFLAKFMGGNGHPAAAGCPIVENKNVEEFAYMSLYSLVNKILKNFIDIDSGKVYAELYHIKEFEWDDENKKFIIK